MENILNNQSSSAGLFLTFGPMILIVIIVAMIVIGVYKKRYKKQLVYFKQNKIFEDKTEKCISKIKKYNIALGVLGAILGLLTIAILVVNFIVVSNSKNDLNQIHNSIYQIKEMFQIIK